MNLVLAGLVRVPGLTRIYLHIGVGCGNFARVWALDCGSASGWLVWLTVDVVRHNVVT